METVFYPVKEGDTLRSIARECYGDESLWQEIFKKNAQVIGPDPAKLVVATTLYIPGKARLVRVYSDLQSCTITEPGGLNIRYGPSSNTGLYDQLPQGQTLNFYEVIEDGENVAGNPRWGHSRQDHY